MLIKSEPNSDLLSLLSGEGVKNSENQLAKLAGEGALVNGEKSDAKAFLKLLEGEGVETSKTGPQAKLNLEGEVAEGSLENVSKAQTMPVMKDGKSVSDQAGLLKQSVKIQPELKVSTEGQKKVALGSFGSEGFVATKLQAQKPVMKTKNANVLAQKESALESQPNISKANQAGLLNPALNLKGTKAAKVLKPQNNVLNAAAFKAKPAQVSKYQKSQNLLNHNLLKPQTSLRALENDHKAEALGDQFSEVVNLNDSNLSEVGAVAGAGKNLESQLGFEGTKLSVKEASQASQNTIDLSQISADNSTELVRKVSDYINRSFLENTQTIDLMVKHDELGHFKINASRVPGTEMVDLEIQTMKAEGHQFFVENEVELMKSVQQAGVKISDIKVSEGLQVMASSASAGAEGKSLFSDSNSQNFDNDFGQSSNSRDSQQGRNPEKRDSERRRQLWEEFERQSA